MKGINAINQWSGNDEHFRSFFNTKKASKAKVAFEAFFLSSTMKKGVDRDVYNIANFKDNDLNM